MREGRVLSRPRRNVPTASISGQFGRDGARPSRQRFCNYLIKKKAAKSKFARVGNGCFALATDVSKDDTFGARSKRREVDFVDMRY